VATGSKHPITWVFDVDGTLVDSMTGTSLRPRAAEILRHLRSTGVTVVLWSAGGADYARRRTVEHGIAGQFSRFAGKAARDAAGRYLTADVVDSHAHVIFVDDMPYDLPIDADVIAVHPYLVANPHDDGLHPVARRAGLVQD
jgi:long-chain acyl-CoA synthetase